ncbi:MAG: glycosyltransferase family 39 protein [Lachnospiraceae bacterium]|nr:glycosyltransferase family 39 protein [Lachnospiraceae bacterium]
MRLKKTRFNDIVWVFYGILVLAFCALVFTRAAGYFFLDVGIGLLFTAFVFILFSVLCFFYYKSAKNDYGAVAIKKNEKILNIVSYGFFGLALCGGIYLRFRQISGNAFVYTNSGSFADEIYYSLYDFIASILGNSYFTAIIINTVLTVCFSVLLFFAFKRLLGNYAAVLSGVFALVSPYFAITTLFDGPEYVSLVINMLVLLFISFMLPGRSIKAIYLVICGLFLGIAVLTDYSAVSFLLVIPVMFIGSKDLDNNEKAVNTLASIIMFLGGILIGLFLGIYIYSKFKGVGFADMSGFILDDFIKTSSPVYFYSETDILSSFILGLLLIPGICAGFMQRKYDCGSAIALILIGFFAHNAFGFSGFVNGKGMMVGVLLSAMAGNFFDMISYKEPNNAFSSDLKDKDSNYEKDSEDEELRILEIETKKETENTENKTNTANKEIITENTDVNIKTNKDAFIPLDNPIHVPEHKNREQVDYDFKVDDDADYDI